MAKRKAVGLEPFEIADREAEIFKQRPLDDEAGGKRLELFQAGKQGEELQDREQPEGETKEAETSEAQEATEQKTALPRVETHTETQSLKCILTQDEIKQAGERMARADGEKRDHEATLKSVVSRYKAKIDESVAIMSSEGEKIRSGYEFRTVDIMVEMDHSAGKVTKTRKDTYEIIEDRRMNEFEAQRKIRF